MKMPDINCLDTSVSEHSPAKSRTQLEFYLNFETPSESSGADDDTLHTNELFLNSNTDCISYISGSDVLIGASETIETEITRTIDTDSTNVILELLPFHAPTEPADYTVGVIADTTHDILSGSVDSESTILDTSKSDNEIQPIQSEQSEAIETKKTRKSGKKAPKKDVKKVKSKRGRKPHFGNNLKPTCTICSVEFTNTASLKTHMLIHSGERPFQCDLCEKSFTRGTVLRIHRRLHTGEKPYKCSSCSSEFVTKEALARHVAKDHAEDTDVEVAKEKPSYVCEICKKRLCSKYSLRSHLNIHRLKNQTDEKEDIGVECTICKKKFTCRYTLQRHVFEKHNRRGIITCNICEQSFSSKWEHSRHQDLHASSNKYQCDICSKTFGKKYQLLYHLQVHEASKKVTFTCYLCKKQYNTRDSFIDHIRIYVQTRKRLYSCPQCPLPFTDPRQLKLHLNEEHKLPVISDLNYCDICKLAYSNANEYYDHLFEKHDYINILCNKCECFFKSRRQYDEHLSAHI